MKTTCHKRLASYSDIIMNEDTVFLLILVLLLYITGFVTIMNKTIYL